MNQPPLLTPEPPWLPELLDALARHEVLAGRQIEALLEKTPADVGPVLERLVRDRQLRIVRAASGAIAYALALRGARLLAETTGREPARVPRVRGSAILEHEILKNELAVVLELLHRRGRLELLRWETARDAISDAVQLAHGKQVERIAVVADALVVIATPAGPTALLVEIDMGTVPVARMAKKYQGYAAWWRGGGPERRFGLRSLRVLTIAKHQLRSDRLREAATEAVDSASHGLFWFASAVLVDSVTPTKLLEPRFATAGRNDQRKLLGGS